MYKRQVLPGSTTADRVAELRPQVGGVLRQRNFEEGQEVVAGQALFHIDPATFEAALETAEAQLARARATADQAETTVNRYRPLDVYKRQWRWRSRRFSRASWRTGIRRR